MGLSGREEEVSKVGRVPPSPIRIGRGAGPPFLLSFSLFLLLLQLGKKGVLLPEGVVHPLGAPSLGGRPLPLGSFIYGGRGHP